MPPAGSAPAAGSGGMPADRGGLLGLLGQMQAPAAAPSAPAQVLAGIALQDQLLPLSSLRASAGQEPAPFSASAEPAAGGVAAEEGAPTAAAADPAEAAAASAHAISQHADRAVADAKQLARHAALEQVRPRTDAQGTGADGAAGRAEEEPLQPSSASMEPAAVAGMEQPAAQEGMEAKKEAPQQSALAASVSAQLLGSRPEGLQAHGSHTVSAEPSAGGAPAAADGASPPQQQTNLAAQVGQSLLGPSSGQADGASPAAAEPVPGAVADKLLAVPEGPSAPVAAQPDKQAASSSMQEEAFAPAEHAVPAAAADKLLVVSEGPDTSTACIPSTASAPPAAGYMAQAPTAAAAAAEPLLRQKPSPRLVDPTMHLGSNELPAANGGTHAQLAAAPENRVAAMQAPKPIDPLRPGSLAAPSLAPPPLAVAAQVPGSPPQDAAEAELWGDLLVDSPSPCKTLPPWGAAKPANG